MRTVIFLSTVALTVGGAFLLNRSQTQKKVTSQQVSMQEDMVVTNMRLQEAYGANQTICIAAKKGMFAKVADTATCSGVTCTLRKKDCEVAFLSTDQALINRAQQRCYLSRNITGTMRNNTQQITLTAQHGTFDLTTKELILDGGVTTEFIKEPDTQQQR
ncbi:hypothetical protein K2X40_02900 [Candidatus Babeliales bacterium]|nr:hypothetical protein [Candidatus Babeliales bacterium]